MADKIEYNFVDKETYALHRTAEVVQDFNLELFLSERIQSEILKGIIKAENGEFITEPIKKGKFLIKHISNVICKYFELKIEVFQSDSRKREVVMARQLAHYFSKKFTKLSLAKIGDEIGGLDHTTVLHSIKTVKNLCDTDKEYFRKFKEIRDKIII